LCSTPTGWGTRRGNCTMQYDCHKCGVVKSANDFPPSRATHAPRPCRECERLIKRSRRGSDERKFNMHQKRTHARHLRASGMSKAEIAKTTGLSIPTVSIWTSDITAKTIMKTRAASTEIQIRNAEILRRWGCGESQTSIAENFNMSRQNVSLIVNTAKKAAL
jgi:DNA-binding CsgD family transcriptional regulator